MNARNRQSFTAARAPLVLAVTAACVLVTASCGDVARTGRSPAMLVIDSLTAASGVVPGTFGVPLGSDVQTIVKRTVDGEEVLVATIFSDLGKSQLRVILKDPGLPGALLTPSPLNSVTINRFRVAYHRADGRNVQGVDVPYTIDGGMTATITDSPSEVGFEMVRIQAKEEAPLRALISRSVNIATIAEVTFYGRDQTGNEVVATGNISVNFGDFADPN